MTVESPVGEVVRRVRGYIGANAALLVSGGVGAAVFAVLINASADVYEAVTNANGVSGLDMPALDFARSQRSPAGERWVTAFTNLGGTSSMVFITLTLTAAMFAIWRRRSIPLTMLIAAAGSLIFTSLGKTVVGRARPPLALAVPPYEYAPSFPSGHTLNSTVIALMLAYFAWWLSRHLWVRVLSPVLGTIWAVAMGLSRVYLGHHWMTDVIFGWVFGLAWLALLITVHRILLRLDRRDRRVIEQGGVPDQPPEKAIEPDGGPIQPLPTVPHTSCGRPITRAWLWTAATRRRATPAASFTATVTATNTTIAGTASPTKHTTSVRYNALTAVGDRERCFVTQGQRLVQQM